MEDQILKLLRQQEGRGVDQGLRVAEIATELDADQASVLAALANLEANDLAHKESSWWYPGPAPDHTGEIDQA